MGRVSFPFFLVLFIAGLSTAAAARDYNWLTGWGSTSTQHDAPAPVDFFEDSAFQRMKLAPSYASLAAPSYSSGPVSYDFVPYLTSSLADNPDQWPEQYPSTTTIEEAFGSDAEQVYGSVSLLDGVSAKGNDGYSQLLKEGVAALMNSIDEHYQYSDDEVKKFFSFKTALSSEATAAEQAHKFEDANLLYAASASHT